MRATPPFATESAAPRAGPLFPLPLSGRQREHASLLARLDSARAGVGTTTLVTGSQGIGKSRLVAAVAEVARRQGWLVAVGRAYPVETGVPYAIFADALTPVVRGLTPASLAVLTRGESNMLAGICPAFSPVGPPAADSSDAKARLLWSFAQFLAQLSAQRPLLLVLENLHWADPSSLELLHFVARQAADQRVAILCTYNDAPPDAGSALRATTQSLVSGDAASVIRLEPLDADALHALIRTAFDADDASARMLSGRLFAWTRGNPFFVEEILKALVHAGALYQSAGIWHGWEAEPPGLPRSIRDALADRLARLSHAARSLANLAAVIGTRTSHDVLAAVLDEGDLLSSLDELRINGVLVEEAESTGGIRYEFTHPLVREVLYAELGIARCRLLHAKVAEGLERLYGASADAHADELAFHFARVESRVVSAKAVRYLAVAGRAAIARHANREAADYLAAALDLCDRSSVASDDAVDAEALAEDLARVRQRLGDYAGATPLWNRVKAVAARNGDHQRLAEIERRLGLAAFWSGSYEEAMRRLGAALDAAARARDPRCAGDDAPVPRRSRCGACGGGRRARHRRSSRRCRCAGPRSPRVAAAPHLRRSGRTGRSGRRARDLVRRVGR